MDEQHPYDERPETDPTAETAPEPIEVLESRPARRGRRGTVLVAGAAATALVAGIGYAVGDDQGGTTETAASGNGTSNGTDGQPPPGWTFSDGSGDSSSDGSGGSGGTYGYGDGLQGQPSLPSLPDGLDPSTGGSGSGTTSGTKASGSQLTGLVRIATTLGYDQASAAGTGMVLTSNGEVVTNHHVVAGATLIKVTVMTTGKTYTAKVVGTDTKDDVAVLRLSGATGLRTVTTDTDGASVGDKVTAVGDANGTAGYLSAAAGTVTGLGESITTQAEGSAASEKLTGLIKISSDVISGDSGGATYDSDGQVVGMTTAASSAGTGVDGYAVPIAEVLRVVDDLEGGVTSSRYTYGYPAFLGVGLGDTSNTVSGVFSGTPASSAGISAGDEITRVGSTSVTTAAQVRRALAGYSPGDQVSITWVGTGGRTQTRTVTLVAGPVA